MIGEWSTIRVVNQKGSILGFWKCYNSLDVPFNSPLRWKVDKPLLHWPLLNWYTKSYGFCKFSKLPTLKLWLKFPETSRLSLKVCQCFFNEFDSYFLCFIVRMSCNPRTATFSCYDKLVNLFEDVFRENECDIERYQNCLGIFLKWDNFEEQINPVHTRPSPLLSNLGRLLFFTCSSNSGTTLYGRGEGEWKLYFLPFLSWRKAREALLDKVSQLSLSPIVAQIVTLLGWEKLP